MRILSTQARTQPLGSMRSPGELSLDEVLAYTLARSVERGGLTREGEAWTRLSRFLAEPGAGNALRCWLGLAPGAALELTKTDLVDRLNADIARLDTLLNDQVNAIIHHPRFQKLEASWRGLHYLTEQAADAPGVKIRLLDLSWPELARDQDRAIDFDQSQFFNKIYNDEFGSPGGEPFGVILGDYEISHRPEVGHPVDDLSVLRSVSHVAAASFAPFITGADPALLGMDSYAELGRPLNLQNTFQQAEYLKWRAFRETEDARFVGVTMPRVLMRKPYERDGSRVDRFAFVEDVRGPDSSRYLWGSAVYAFGAVLAREFGQTGWLARIQGVSRGEESGGLVTELPLASFSTDATGIAPKYSTDVLVTDVMEQELSELGLIALCHCKDTPSSAFYGTASVQKAKVYDTLIATTNARMSAMLQYVFLRRSLRPLSEGHRAGQDRRVHDT